LSCVLGEKLTQNCRAVETSDSSIRDVSVSAIEKVSHLDHFGQVSGQDIVGDCIL